MENMQLWNPKIMLKNDISDNCDRILVELQQEMEGFLSEKSEKSGAPN